MASAFSSFLSSVKSVFPKRNTKSSGNSNSSNIHASTSAVNTSSSLLSPSASSPAHSPDAVATPIPTLTPVPTATSITSEAPSSSNHSVQFYESQTHLIQSMTQLIQTALTVGDAVILIVHEDHRIELEHSVAQLLQKQQQQQQQQQQQVWILDVCDTLVQFGAKARTTPKMSESIDNISSSSAATTSTTTSTTTSSQTGNATDWSCYSSDAMSFSGVMGTLLYGCMSYFPRVHVYDETGSFLLRHNNLDGMTDLEQLWNGLQQTFTFTLRCAYPAQYTGTPHTRGEHHHHHHDYTKTGLTPVRTYNVHVQPNLTLSTIPADSMQPPITTTNMPTGIVRDVSQTKPSSTEHTSSMSPTPTSSATPSLSPVSRLSLTNHPTSTSIDPYQRICECHSYILPQEHQMNNADIELELRHIRFMDRQYQHVLSAKKLPPTTTQPTRNQQQSPQQSPAQSQLHATSQTPKGKFNGSGGISLRTRTRVQAQLPSSSSSGSGTSFDMGVAGTSTVPTNAHAQQFVLHRHRQYKKPHIDHLSGLSHTVLRPVTVLPTSPMSPITPPDFSMHPPPQSIIRPSSVAKLSLSGTVLVAEDNVINSRIICAMLNRLGFESIVAWNGQECLRKLREQQQTIHAILMDMQMPVMDGLDATRAIRSLRTEAAHIPIIALTANVSVSDRRACHEAGMDAFLPKPVTMQQLAQQLETSLHISATTPPSTTSTIIASSNKISVDASSTDMITSPPQASLARRTSQFTQVETQEEAPLFHHDPD